MKRSLFGLLALCALTACDDTPPGQLTPIPRPPGYEDPPPPPPSQAAEPAPDPNKAVLRWKLTPGAPMAFRLVGTPDAAPAKGASVTPLRATYVLQRPEEGDTVLRIIPEGAGATPDQGTLSERGFVLDGLRAIDRNTATLLLELPRDPVGVGDKWSLGADLVDTDQLGPDFVQKKSQRRNTVKLVGLAPQGDEQVATLEYDIHEHVSGHFTPVVRHGHDHHGHAPARPARGKGKKADAHEEEEGPRPVLAEVTVTGRGEFLVKAGRWRSWKGTLSSRTEGYTPSTPEKAAAQVPSGSFQLQLTPLDSVPPEPKKASRR